MTLFDAFIKQAPNRVFLSILLGSVAGMSYALLIPIVLSAISDDPNTVVEAESSVRTVLSLEVNHFKVATLFLFLVIFILVTRTLSQVILARVSIDLTTEIRVKLYQRIMETSIDVLENVGSSKLIATITTDVARIVNGAKLIPDMLISIVTIIGLLGFTMYLNFDVFLFVVGAITFGIITYQLPITFSQSHFEYSRRKVDDLQESVRGLIYGAKELKSNQIKADAYFKQVLLDNEYAVRTADKKGVTIVRATDNYGDMISFFVIGIVAFILVNYESMTNEELVGVVMALLYITGPIGVIIMAIPDILIARVSLNKVNRIFSEIPQEQVNHQIKPLPDYDGVEFKDVCYQYQTEDGDLGFKVGPVNLTIDKSAITFIVGGNGSGKSTLSKMLTLHHLPTSGTIHFGDTVVDDESVRSCRQQISSIYSDYYLFDRLLDQSDVDNQHTISDYLKVLGLADKVTIEDGRFSTLDLSDGQKRRLALLVAFLEDKAFYLFDEWAADQDPMFKAFFYHQVLPDLKAKGKAVVVISHDDRYFDIADKILVMENGQLVKCITQREAILNKDIYGQTE